MAYLFRLKETLSQKWNENVERKKTYRKSNMPKTKSSGKQEGQRFHVFHSMGDKLVKKQKF